MSHRSSAENLLLISCSNPNISLYGFSVNFSEIELHRLSWIFSSWWIYFCCCSRFSVEQSVLPRLLYKYTGTNLEGYRFLCQVQIHRHQNCLLKKKKQIEVSTEWHFLSCIIAWRSWFFNWQSQFFPVCINLEYIGITFYIGHHHVMKNRVIKLKVDLEVLPCLLDKLFSKFPATSCSDSISICDKDNNNNSRLTFYFITMARKKLIVIVATLI